MVTFASILVLCLSSIIAVNSQHDHKVKVAVYYESMCPDSIAFVTTQLYPALQIPELNQHINLTLVPYGKTKITKDATGSQFTCHHGPAECTGNKIHACALRNIKPEENGQNKVAVDFVNCLLHTVMLDKDNTKFPTKTCAESQKVINLLEIENCANSHEGVVLLEEAGMKTDAVQKGLESSPTIVFDSKFDKTESKKAEKNFVEVLCSHIDHAKPAACTQKNSAVPQTVSLGISLLTLFLTLTVF